MRWEIVHACMNIDCKSNGKDEPRREKIAVRF